MGEVYLPQANPDGLPDHVLIHVPAGIDDDIRRVLGALKTLKGFDGQEMAFNDGAYRPAQRL